MSLMPMFNGNMANAAAAANIGFVGDKSSGTTNGAITLGLSSGLANGSASSVSEGDIVIAIHCHAGYDETRTPVAPTESGYTTIVSNFQDGTNDSALYVGYKVMGATPDANCSFAAPSYSSIAPDQCVAAVFVFSGVDGATPMDVAATSTAANSSTNLPDPPAITPITDGAWIVPVVSISSTDNSETLTPSDMTYDNELAQDGTGAHAHIGWGYYSGWTSGAFDPGEWVWTGNDSVHDTTQGVTIALRPG